MATEPITWTNEKRKLSQLIPWKRNPRQIKGAEVTRLQESLVEFGQVEPTAIGPDNELYNGHQRLKSWAAKFGDIEIDVRVSSRALTEKEREKLTVYLHKGAAGSWDFDTLANEFEVGELLEWGFSEIELVGNGFTMPTEEQPEPEEIQPDRFEEVQKKWNTSEGQIWKLGKHKILCGNSLDGNNIAAILEEEEPALIIGDPPYGVNIVAANGYLGSRKKGYVGGGNSIKDRTGHYPIEGWKKAGTVGASKPFGNKAARNVRGTDGAAHIVEAGKYPVIIGDENTETAKKAVELCLDFYPESIQVWWGANYYSDILPPSMCWLVWNKETTGNFADCELAWTNQNKAAKLFTHRWNGMLRDSERDKRWHPTQKPAALAAWVYGEFTEQEAIIFDPFAGAGWSVLGGEQSNRVVRAIEKSPEYIAVILERWAAMTGGTPELLTQEESR